ncbi:unnamed protein product [Sphagnum troendelagicum]
MLWPRLKKSPARNLVNIPESSSTTQASSRECSREQRTLVNVPENARRQKRTLVNVPESHSYALSFSPA